MHFRFYQDAIGRFLKPDNIAGNPANPQSWNRYSYCGGNPVNFTDPTGHAFTPPGQHQGWINVPHSFGGNFFHPNGFMWNSTEAFIWALETHLGGYLPIDIAGPIASAFSGWGQGETTSWWDHVKSNMFVRQFGAFTVNPHFWQNEGNAEAGNGTGFNYTTCNGDPNCLEERQAEIDTVKGVLASRMYILFPQKMWMSFNILFQVTYFDGLIPGKRPGSWALAAIGCDAFGQWGAARISALAFSPDTTMTNVYGYTAPNVSSRLAWLILGEFGHLWFNQVEPEAVIHRNTGYWFDRLWW